MKEYSLTPKTINYKAIQHERCEDAPFVGALISACDCKFNCPHCFNQGLKKMPTVSKSPIEIIQTIKNNPFNRGIIFGGLEWSLQINECIELARVAKAQGLQTMVYTGCNFNSYMVQQYIKANVFDYIKCGRYEEHNKTINHIEYGVVLASDNQHVYKRGVDY